MRNTPLLIANKIDAARLAIYRDIHAAANAVGADWLVIGATARDLIYEAAFDVNIKRATKDIDFAIHIDNWQILENLTTSLIRDFHFSPTKFAHRLELPDSNLWIDIIPFGKIAGDSDTYRWPSEPQTEFSILGFQEALDTALLCRISEEPVLDLKVIHPAVLILLKIISWRDRKHQKRTDAQDVAYAMSNYIKLDNNEQRLYDEPALFDDPFDMQTIGARLAGRDLASLAPGKALNLVKDFIRTEIALGNKSEFLADMMLGSSKLFADTSLYGQLLPNFVKGIDEG